MNDGHVNKNDNPQIEFTNSNKLFNIINSSSNQDSQRQRKNIFQYTPDPNAFRVKSENSALEDKIAGKVMILAQDHENLSRRSNSDVTITDKSDEVTEKCQGDQQFNIGRWSEEEHRRFMEGILIYGNDWKRVQKVLVTRSSTQARSHAQKFFQRVRKYFNLLQIEGNNNLLLNETNSSKNREILENSSKYQDLRNFNILWRFICDIKNDSNDNQSGFNNIYGENLTLEQKRAIVKVILQFTCEPDLVKAIKKKRIKEENEMTTESRCNISKVILEQSKLFGSKIFNIEKQRKSSISKKRARTNTFDSIINIKGRRNSEKINEVAMTEKCEIETYTEFLNKKRKNSTPNFPTCTSIISDSKFYTNIYDELKSLYINKQRAEVKSQGNSQEDNMTKAKSQPFMLQSMPRFLKDENIFDNVNFLSSSKKRSFHIDEDKNPFNINFFKDINSKDEQRETSLYDEECSNFPDFGNLN